MDSKIQKSLEQARAYFYSLKLVESYNILRRYFDRLPFQPEKGHAEFIGMFVRILSELGKEYELNFYLGELEKLHDKYNQPEVTYQLAVVYAYLTEPRLESSRKLLEAIVRNPAAQTYHAKAKMMLADYYDRVNGDVAACRQLIDSIADVSDPVMVPLVKIWKAKVLRDERRFDEAQTQLNEVFDSLRPEENWYAFFCAKIIQAGLFVKRGTPKDVGPIIEEIRALFAGRNFKSVAYQLGALEKLVRSDREMTVLRFTQEASQTILSYENKSLPLNAKSPSDKLLLLLAKRGYLDKAFIVKSLYARTYDAERDDKLIYYHIHSLRKRLKLLGLPPDAITNDGDGYRLRPEVETLGEGL
jgi:hypothetical protein